MSDTELDAEQQRGLNIVILKVAEARMNEAYNAFRYASDNAHNAEAEVARLTLLKFADEIPGLDGMTFETQYEYDDEGGYFRTISCYPTFEEDKDYDYDENDFIDLMNGFTAESICVLCECRKTRRSGRSRSYKHETGGSSRVTEPCGSASQS